MFRLYIYWLLLEATCLIDEIENNTDIISKSIKILKKWIKENPEEIILYKTLWHLYEVYWWEHNIIKVIKKYKKLLKLKPHSSSIYFEIAWLYRQLWDKNQSFLYYKYCLNSIGKNIINKVI